MEAVGAYFFVLWTASKTHQDWHGACRITGAFTLRRAAHALPFGNGLRPFANAENVRRHVSHRENGVGPLQIELVIFDCDGVLVDSEPISNQVLAESIRELGLSYSYEETVQTFVGRSMSSCLALIEELLGRSVPSDFGARHESRLLERLGQQVEAVPGVAEVLDGLTLPYCVASSGEPAKMRTTLGRVGLLSRFESRMFSAVDVARGKPAPDLFLYAARQMGVEPARCAVVEDTVLGVRAAVAAGMEVLGYTRTVGAESLQRAGARTFDDMSELPLLLANVSAQHEDQEQASKHGA